MDPSLLHSRSVALHTLLRAQPSRTASLISRIGALASGALAPKAILQQTSPLSTEQCAILTDWIARVTLTTQQSVSNGAAPVASSTSDAAAALPAAALCTHVVRLFRPLLSALLARICNDDATHFANIPAFLHASDVLTHIATLCPHVLPTITAWFRRAPFSLMSCLSSSASPSTDLRVSFVALRLLHLDAPTFRTLWDWAPFMRLLSDADALTRWMTAHSVAILLRMNEHDRAVFVRQTMQNAGDAATASSVETTAAHVYDQYLACVHLEQALVWIDSKENDALRMPPVAPAADAAAIDLTAGSSDGAVAPSMDKQLSTQMVSLGGVLLPRRIRPASASSDSASPSPLIHVASTAAHLRSIGLSLCERRPVLLEGPSGCGKTVLIEECARLCGQYSELVRLHLDDQMDSKTLLGTYTCTDIPGEFRWAAGALTQAVTEGRWVLIEDIDRCSFEILSALISLLERRELFMPGRGETIRAAEGFQLFATRSVAHNGAPPPVTESTPLLHALFSRIHVQPLTYDELTLILAHRLGARLASRKLIAQILQSFHSFVSLPGFPSADASPSPFAAGSLLGSGRKYSTRDLLKWVARIELLLRSNPEFDARAEGNGHVHLTAHMNEGVFLAAMEVFVAPIPPPHNHLTAAGASASAVAAAISAAGSDMPLPGAPLSPRQQVISHLAALWRVDPDRVHFFTHAYKPRIEVGANTLSIGTVTVPRASTLSAAHSANQQLLQHFAHTKYSLTMMQQLLSCTRLSEPVLLVSDTGVGKTTTIQYLASLLGKKLHVQNLNAQSDSADLIGGFKPVEVGKLIVPLMNSFGSLFPRTFSRGQNADFLASLRGKYEEKKWRACVRMMQQSVESAEKKLGGGAAAAALASSAAADDTPRKQSKTTSTPAASLLSQWASFSAQLAHFSHQLSQLSSAFVFAFQEGSLVAAIRNGDWILLDEINLASSETLERLSGILEGAGASLSLTERGDSASLVRHPEFRLFGAVALRVQVLNV